DTHSAVARAASGIFNLYINSEGIVIDLESISVGKLGSDVFAFMMREISANVARNTPMTHCIHSVWRKSDFINPIRIWFEEVSCVHTWLRSGRQHHNSSMRIPEANLIFCADHAMTFFSANFCNLHGKRVSTCGVNG